MIRCRSITLISAVLAVLLIGSCASFRADRAAPTTPWPPPRGQSKSVRLRVDFKPSFNGSTLEGASGVIDKISTETARIYVESGLFSQVRRGNEPTDLIADISIDRAEEGSIGMAVLTGLTLYLIPSKSDVSIKVKTTFRNPDGDALGTIEKEEVVTTWQELFLFPVMFFKYPIPVFWRAFDDVHRATLEDARARGIV